jgi:hypothetical protein
VYIVAIERRGREKGRVVIVKHKEGPFRWCLLSNCSRTQTIFPLRLDANNRRGGLRCQSGRQRYVRSLQALANVTITRQQSLVTLEPTTHNSRRASLWLHTSQPGRSTGQLTAKHRQSGLSTYATQSDGAGAVEQCQKHGRVPAAAPLTVLWCACAA